METLVPENLGHCNFKTLHMSKLLLLISVFCLNTVIVIAGNESSDTIPQKPKHPLAFSGYQGGMMFHSGYVTSREYSIYDNTGAVVEKIKSSGSPIGIGGALRINFGEHLRIGTEGYVSTLHSKNNSYSSVGWGGLLVDSKWEIKRWTIFTGAVIGGGSVKSLIHFNNTPNDYTLDEYTSFRKYAFCAVAPFFGAEYALTSKIHLVMKADYLLNVSNFQDDYPSGIRLFIGFMFCH